MPLAYTKNNIQAVHVHTRLTMNGALKYFLNKGDP
jgi:hypothetical protein